MPAPAVRPAVGRPQEEPLEGHSVDLASDERPSPAPSPATARATVPTSFFLFFSRSFFPSFLSACAGLGSSRKPAAAAMPLFPSISSPLAEQRSLRPLACSVPGRDAAISALTLRWSSFVSFAAARTFAASLLSFPFGGTANIYQRCWGPSAPQRREQFKRRLDQTPYLGHFCVFFVVRLARSMPLPRLVCQRESFAWLSADQGCVKTTLSHSAFEHQGSLHLCPDISCTFGRCWCKANRLK